MEPLESRRLTSLTWANVGPKDGFQKAYGANADVARMLVRAALADWSAAIPAAKLKLKISALDLQRGNRNSVLLGQTSGSSVQLDKDAAGAGWYFDPDLADDADFPGGIGAYARSSTTGDSGLNDDFFSAVLHEVGHALGFSDKSNPYVDDSRRKPTRDIHHSAVPDDLMRPAIGHGLRRLISPYDVRHTTLGKAIAAPDIPTYFSASATTDQPVTVVSWAGSDKDDVVSIFRSATPISSPSDAGATLLATNTGDGSFAFYDTSAPAGSTSYYLVEDSGAQGTVASGMLTGMAAGGKLFSWAAGADGASLVVSWAATPGATYYQVRRTDVDDSRADWFGSPTNSYVDAAVHAGETYTYTVMAQFGELPHHDSSKLPSTVSAALAPKISAASASQGLPITAVSWTTLGNSIAANDPHEQIDRFEVYGATALAEDGTRESSGARLLGSYAGDASKTHAFYDFQARAGVTTYYWVRAVKVVGGDEIATEVSAGSGFRSFNPQADLSQFGSVRATRGQPDIAVTWDALPGTASYQIYKATILARGPGEIASAPPAMPAAPVATVSAGATSWTLSGSQFAPGAATTGEIYAFRVVAVPSDPAQAPTTLGEDLGASDRFAASTDQPGKTVLTFTTFSYGGVAILRSDKNTGSFVGDEPTYLGSAQANHEGVTFEDTTGEPGVDYTYWLLITDNQGNAHEVIPVPAVGRRG